MLDRSAAVTIDHVALAAGVSRSTASRVLSGTGSTSALTNLRVRSAAERLGYVANPLARALARGQAGTRVVIAVSAPSPEALEDTYLGQVVSGAATVCDQDGVGVSLQWLPLDAPSDRLDRLAADRSVRGVVLVHTTRALLAAMPSRLRGRVASIGLGGPGVPSFDVDNSRSSAALVRHLLGTGRRRIVMVSGPQWLPCAQRPVEAYRAIMRSAGLPDRVLSGDFTVAAGHAGALEALRRWPETDAVVGICDATALGALAALRGLGVDVPGDVAVTGFDDVPFAALSVPTLTTATHPVQSIAAAAATAVLDSSQVPPSSTYPSELVLRESA
jgi:DNA-binding LacI/PurR family transcriptional regulator